METELGRQYAVYLENFRNLEFRENEVNKFAEMVPCVVARGAEWWSRGDQRLFPWEGLVSRHPMPPHPRRVVPRFNPS